MALSKESIASSVKGGKTMENKTKKVTKLLTSRTNKVGQSVAYMTIPVAFATLPKDSSVIQKKRLNVVDVKGGQGFEIYVLACSKKREYKKFDGTIGYVQNWYVARKRYFSGKPAFDEKLYDGTSERDARHRFADIPYNELRVKVPEGKLNGVNTQVVEEKYTSSTGKQYITRWAVYKSDGKYATIAANRSQRYQARARRSNNSDGARLQRRRRNG